MKQTIFVSLALEQKDGTDSPGARPGRDEGGRALGSGAAERGLTPSPATKERPNRESDIPQRRYSGGACF